MIELKILVVLKAISLKLVQMAIQIQQFFLSTVKAEIEKINGGTNCDINHLSIRGMIFSDELIFLEI